MIDFVSKHRAGIATEFPGIVFNGGLEVIALFTNHFSSHL